MKKYIDLISQFIPLIVLIIFTIFYFKLLSPFIISIIVAYLLNNALIFMEKYISRPASLIIIFIFLAFIAITLTFGIIPMLINEISNFIKKIPAYLNEFDKFSKYDFPYKKELSEKLNSEIANLANSIVSFSYNLLLGSINFIVNLITIPIFVFYFLKDKEKMIEFFKNFIPKKYEDFVYPFLKKIDIRMRGFLKGQFLDFCLLAGIIGIGLTFMNIDYAVSLGIIAALLNLIPYLGIILGGIAVAGVAYVQSYNFITLIEVIVFFSVVQFVESNLLAPNIIGNSAKVHPLAIILAIMVGGASFGINGILMAIPFLIVLDTFIEHFNIFEKNVEN